MVWSNFKDFIGNLPQTGKILAVDWGEKRTGIAISDDTRDWAFPRPQMAPDAAKIAGIAADERAVGILVGLPPAGRTADKITQFAQKLALQTEIPILLYDEHLTSSAAADLLQAAGINSKNQKPMLDSAAALVILEEFLERIKNV